jgi:hypothetical protein
MSLCVPLLNLPSAGHKTVAGEENSGAGGRTYTVDPVGNDRAGKGVECFVPTDCILFMYLASVIHHIHENVKVALNCRSVSRSVFVSSPFLGLMTRFQVTV